MKIKIERKEKPQKPKKQKKTPTIKLGTHKKLTIVLWVLLIGSVSFGVYKNFTAIDMHTIHEKEVIETKVVDTNRIESFVKSFAGDYYSWQQSQESIDNRNERLNISLRNYNNSMQKWYEPIFRPLPLLVASRFGVWSKPVTMTLK